MQRWQDIDEDPAELGSILHKILEDFFVAQDENSGPSWKELHKTYAGDFRTLALDRLCKLTKSYLPKTQLALGQQLIHQSWPKFVEHLIQHFPNVCHDPSVQILKELRIEPSGKWKLPEWSWDAHHQTMFTGAIDSIDIESDVAVLTDYKTSTVPSRSELEQGKVPQLVIYTWILKALLPQLNLKATKLVAAYYNIKEGAFEVRLIDGDNFPAQLQIKTGRFAPVTLESAMSSLKASFQLRLTDVSQHPGGFHPDPTQCDYCEYEGICRKSDPSWPPAMRPIPRQKEWFK